LPIRYSAGVGSIVAQISKMWETEPNWTDARPTAVDPSAGAGGGWRPRRGDQARAHTEYIAATIAGAGLLILPNTSHFAFLQDPTLFNAAQLISSATVRAQAGRPFLRRGEMVCCPGGAIVGGGRQPFSTQQTSPPER
jgi:hypothetical protein